MPRTAPLHKLEALVPPLKAESLQCLYRFARYRAEPFPLPLPLRRQAAVAIVLFVGRLGDLYVLLSTRAGNMRSFAKDTALPGGKYEPGDSSPEDTARREAYEEIGLPIDIEKVVCLTTLDVFLTGNGLLVTPVVLLVTDHTINPILNPAEVSQIFSMPLSAFLHSNPSKIPGWGYGLRDRSLPFIPPLVPRSSPTSTTLTTSGGNGSEALPIPAPPVVEYANGPGEVGGRGGYYQYRDVPWGKGVVRMHRFLTGKENEGVRPVYGLTSAILIHAAVIGYDAEPAFERCAPSQPGMFYRIHWEIMYGKGPLRRAVEVEGLWDYWKNVRMDSLSKAKL